MAVPQRIVRIRREYNQWVANQTLEDFALRFTAAKARQWSVWRVANTALGSTAFLALEAIGAAITLNYGFTNSVAAILVVGALIFLTGLPISYYAAKYGVDMDLLSRGAGFGYLGSTITSLIYASFTFIFFALEAAIMAMALELCFDLPLAIGYIVCALVVIPIVTHGITFISRFQTWTQPLWLLLHVTPFLFIAWNSPESFHDWTSMSGRSGSDDGHFDILLFGAAASVVFALVPQIGEQVDFLRFLPRARGSRRQKLAWWTALIAAGPGWVVAGVAKMLAGSFLLFLAMQEMIPLNIASEPIQMYLVAFRHVFDSPHFALGIATLFVVLCQIKINVTNAYAGSIAWSNFFARLTHSHPGRVVWLGFNVLIALLLMELGVFQALERILGLYSNVAIAWISTVVADLVINKPLGLSPPHIEFKRAHLYDINPVGVGAMGIACVVALTAYIGLFGPVAQATSPFFAFATAFVATPAIAWITGGRYYLARTAQRPTGRHVHIRCVVCEHRFEREDMAHCPAYEGWICSLCCSLDARCHDTCKTRSRMRDQIIDGLRKLLPERLVVALDSRLGHYLGIFSLALGLIGGTLMLLYFQQTLDATYTDMAPFVWKVFVALALIAGVVSWIFILTDESSRVAQQESNRQMQLLTQEVEAHKRTDAKLKKAKEAAEAANLAKSRFVTGLSHELRTPLNAILGFAQLLDQQRELPDLARDATRVIRRSGEHLSQLIDGLLDIAKIEAGKLHLHRDVLNLPALIGDLAMMFEPQARARGIAFKSERPKALPAYVQVDGKRLRQILINLLSNAIKFTERGSVTFRIRYQQQTAVFDIVDTGPGIATADQERIFAPFERGLAEHASSVTGMGLGLTISRLLAEIMGGQLSVRSTPGKGSTFSVRMILSEVTAPAHGFDYLPEAARIVGYEGPRRTVMVADDEADSRDLMRRLLDPIGFKLVEVCRGDQCLAAALAHPPDLLLLDISMPGLNGWEVARQLRLGGLQELPIVMVSADAFENRRLPGQETYHNDFVVKPIDLEQVLGVLRRHLMLTWQVEEPRAIGHGQAGDTDDYEDPGTQRTARPEDPESVLLSADTIEELEQLVAIGHVRGLLERLDAIAQEEPRRADLVVELRSHVRDFRLTDFRRTLEQLRRGQA